MPGSQSHVTDDHQRRRPPVQRSAALHAVEGHISREAVSAAGGQGAALLADARLGGRGNGPVRVAALQRLQQEQGNRATRRLVQRLRPSARPVAVQRCPGGCNCAGEHEPVQAMRTGSGAGVIGPLPVQRGKQKQTTQKGGYQKKGYKKAKTQVPLKKRKTNYLREQIRMTREAKNWKKGRQWPEEQLKGLILERCDQFMVTTKKSDYIDMNNVQANFPAVDGIANGKFRQVKCYLPGISGRANAIKRIVSQAEELDEKCQTAARWLTRNKGKLLREVVKRNKKGSPLPSTFHTLAKEQVKEFDKGEEDFDWDEDGLAQEMIGNMVMVVPDDMVDGVKKELKNSAMKDVRKITVEGGGLTSTEVKDLMDETGYAQKKKRGGEDDDEDYEDD